MNSSYFPLRVLRVFVVQGFFGAGIAAMDSSQGPEMERLPDDPQALVRRIRRRLCRETIDPANLAHATQDGAVTSSVLLLLGMLPTAGGGSSQVHLILNERSRRVRQSGDICCPGGAVEPRIDPLLARLPLLPSLGWWRRRSCLRELNRRDSGALRRLRLYWATCLRESWEEMRLNPFRVQFLGVLPPQRLLLFRRVIQPLVGWVNGQNQFVPNWEVAKVVAIPLRELFDPRRHARYRMHVSPQFSRKINRRTEDFPCFPHQNGTQVDILWGATFRIVLLLLERLFGFRAPDPDLLPIVPGLLDEGYINGRDQKS